jgi:lysozyme
MMVTKDAKRYGAILGAAAALAAGFEGLRQYAYYDPRPGDAILTVCYGSTTQVQKGKKYSFRTVERCHPNLPDNVLIAFADAVYNIGPKVACNSTASKYLKDKNYEAACNQLPRWNKSNGVVLPGLTRRREAERQICLDFQQP